MTRDRFGDDPDAIPGSKAIRKGIIRAYDSATHRADVQIVGSHPTRTDGIPVATDIPAADVVAGRQCAVLFLQPSDPDAAVVITIQGAAPSTGSILVATATTNLTLTTTAQSIIGDGDSSKVRILLPTPGDWLVEATCDFHITTLAANQACIGELFVNDSGSAETGALVKEMQALDRATVAQRWKVTTTAANTPVELKARKDTSSGVARAEATQTRLTAIGPNRTADPIPATSVTVVNEVAFSQAAAAGSAGDHSDGDHTHGTPTDPVPAHVAASDPHTVYGALAQAETWAGLQTFNAGAVVVGTHTIGAAGGTPHIDITDQEIAFLHKAFPPSAEVISLDAVDLITLNALGVGLPVGLHNDLKMVTLGAAIQDMNANDRIVMADDGINTLHFPQESPLQTGNGKVLWNFGGSTPVNVTAGLGFSLISNTPSPAATVQGGAINMGWSGTGTALLVLGAELLAYLAGTGTITELIGGKSTVRSTAAGTITEAITHLIAAPDFASAKPTTHAGLRVENQGVSGITTSFAIIVKDQSGSTTNVALSLGTGDVGFYAATPVAQQTGVAVTAAAIHAALVNLGLITA